MNLNYFKIAIGTLAGFFAINAAANPVTKLTNTENIIWSSGLTLPPLPESQQENIGLAGVYSGFIGETLVVAGGANFPNGTPSEGGAKCWWDDVYTWTEENGWNFYDGAMPQSSAYGLTAKLPSGLLLVGGCNAEKCHDEVYRLTLDDKGGPVFEQWPSLPMPLSNMAGGVIGSKVYVAGGVSAMTDQSTLKVFYCLDSSNPGKGWTELPAWDGPSRAFAVAAVQSDGLDNCLYLFSGREFHGDEPWNVLSDGWVYNPRLNEWAELSGDFPVMAGTAMSFGTNHILLFGGCCGRPDEDDNVVRLYHTVTGSMIKKHVEDVVIPVTSAAVRSRDGFLIVSGEVAPYMRTPVILQGTIENRIKHMGWLDYLVIVIYFGLMAWIGIHFSKKQKNTDDYFKGGGRIPWFIVGLSIFGTGLSAITFMSVPAKAYATDWSYLLFNAGIVLVVPLIIHVFIPFFRKLNVTTAYEYLEKRFNSAVRVLCSISFIIYQIGRMGVVLLLPAIALNVVTGFNIFICISLMGMLALIYTYMGGIEAVAWTDALQVVVLLGAAVAVIISVCHGQEGGIGSVIATAAADNKFNLGSLKFDLRQSTIWTVLIATVFTNITTYGTDQTIVQRYLTTETEKQARKGVYTNALLCIPATVLFFFVGTCLYVFFKNNPSELSTAINDADAILPWYVSIRIPAGVMGLVIAGIFAAAMSTISASMNSAATAYVTDIHSKLGCDKDFLKVAKKATVAIGLTGIAFALMMATWDIKSLWDEFSKILGILLGGLGGLFLLGFISKKANSIGAICGLVGCICVQLTVMHFQAVNLLLYSTVGFISCFVTGWIVSVFTGGCKKDISSLTIRK